MPNTAIYAPDFSTRYRLPIFLGRLPAGFPSPADDYLEGKLDINKHLVKHPAATFYVRVSGDSMLGAGIQHRHHHIAVFRFERTVNYQQVAAMDTRTEHRITGHAHIKGCWMVI